MKPQPATIVDSALFTGLVLQKYIHQIQVLAGDHTLMCALPPHLAAHVAAGDVVCCEPAPAPNLPRHHLLFNVSRSIIYAADDASFGRQARVVARYYYDMINKTRDKVMGHTQS